MATEQELKNAITDNIYENPNGESDATEVQNALFPIVEELKFRDISNASNINANIQISSLECAWGYDAVHVSVRLRATSSISPIATLFEIDLPSGRIFENTAPWSSTIQITGNPSVLPVDLQILKTSGVLRFRNRTIYQSEGTGQLQIINVTIPY